MEYSPQVLSQTMDSEWVLALADKNENRPNKWGSPRLQNIILDFVCLIDKLLIASVVRRKLFLGQNKL